MSSAKTIGVVLFDGFETLDVYGPLGLLVSAALDYPYNAVLIGPPNTKSPGSVLSSSQLPTMTSETLQFPPIQKYDVLLIPGGLGNRPLLNDKTYLNALEKNAEAVLESGGTVLCVCTGSILLAATGILDGKPATTNKKAYDGLTPKYPKVRWKRQARWVVDGQIITSGGITAGMDAALYLMASQFGEAKAIQAANRAEYLWNQDADVDPFSNAVYEELRPTDPVGEIEPIRR